MKFLIHMNSLGSLRNPLNVVLASINGLRSLKTPEEVASLRGKEIQDLDLPDYYIQ